MKSKIKLTLKVQTQSQTEFPTLILLAKGYTEHEPCWGNDNLPFCSIETGSGFKIYVAGETEVYIEKSGVLTPLPSITTPNDLFNLERMLS